MTVASDTSPGSAGNGKVKAWPPGFRFHPTDEELVLYYLKRKICRKRLRPDTIGENDVYKWEPEELPGLSLLQTGDRQWYFFTPRDRKYPNGARSNRATRHGYWKATGKDRNITCNSRNVGVKKTLVFYKGKAPSGERTDWVMHEYTLDEEELRRCLNFEENYALYKVFKKSGPGPKNGEQYGAPFNEEEWAEDEDVDFNAITADIEFPRKQVGEDMPPEIVTIRDHAELSWDGDNIDDMINEILDKPSFNMPHVVENAYSVSQVGEEGTQCTAVQQLPSDLIARAPLQALYPVSQQCNVQPSDFVQSSFTQLPMHESSMLTSASVIHQTYYPDSQQYDSQLSYEFNPNSCQLPLYETSEVTSSTYVHVHKRKIPGEGDFLEIDDLLSPDPILSNADESADGLHIDDLDGLGDFDLYHDAASAFEDMGSIDHNLLSFMNTLGDNDVVNHEFQMPQNPEVSYHMDDQLWSDSQRSAFHSAELIDGSLSQQISGTLYESGTLSNDAIHNSNSNEGAGASRFSSALWAFVESVPTNPASASEGKLVDLALERMSSVRRLKNHVKPTVDTAGNDNSSTRQAPRKRVSFIFFQVIVAFCAMLWISMGTIRLLGIPNFTNYNY